jgi:hemolysin activation/secretion protein
LRERVGFIIALSWAALTFAQDAELPRVAPETQPAVALSALRFEGNTAFLDREFLAAPVVVEQRGDRLDVKTRVADYVGKGVSSEDLESIRLALTRLYVSAGYINCGAVLPDQTVESGVVTYKLVEGKLTDVRVTGNKHLRRHYIVSRVVRGGAAGPPLNIIRLKNELEILRQDPNLERITAELRPGAVPGEAYLETQVTETNPLQLGLQVSNRLSPSIGAEQVEAFASHRDLTGNGDTLALRYGMNTGGFEDWKWAGDDDFSIDYTIPISPSDTTLTLSFTRTDSDVVEQQFAVLGITSRTNSAALTLRQPVYRTTASEAAVFLLLGYRDNQTELLGNPFDFSRGTHDGKSVVAPLRFGQEFTTHSNVSGFAARSTFSVGTKMFGATSNDDRREPDGQFFTWLGQVQYVRRLNPETVDPMKDWQLVLRGAVQVASDPLLPIEQFAVGGIDTVRGYRENQIVRDTGLAGSVEIHVPLIATPSGQRVLEAVPFFDIGYGQNKGSGHSDTLPSVGIGLQYTPNKHVTAQVFYGYALNRDVNREHDDLQDAGIHFNLLLLAF